MNMLYNERIQLRGVEQSDLMDMYTWENDTENWSNSETYSPYSEYTLQEFIEQSKKDVFENKQIRFIIECKNTKQKIGAIDLFDIHFIHRKAAIGILINKKFRQKGYAHEALQLLKTYAFEHLNLHQLYCIINEGNTNSIKLFTNNKFIKTGVYNDWLIINNQFHNAFFYQCIE